ncbi:unnamed protein product [Effrenium voratum]|nr:unnamed protein product [Effrenium voratum]
MQSCFLAQAFAQRIFLEPRIYPVHPMASANQPEFAWLLESGIEDIEARQSPPTNGGSRLRLLALVPVALFSLFATGHTKPGTVLDGGWLQLSESLFEPVDGGLDRACRGASSNDNQGWYFNVVSAADLASCQLMCLETVGCAGVEYADAIDRCEIWTRPEGIQASRSSQGSVCFRRVGVFEPVDGGIERACRGSNAYDNSPSYFEVRVVQLLQDCQKECLQTPQCTGIEFSIGRCEVWTRPEGIEASIALPGFSCYRAESFATTLTATSSMTSTATFTSFSTSATSTATSTATMTGTSTTVTTDTATTTGTITATSTATSTTPLATTPASTVPTTDVFFRGIDGGVDRVCRGATSTDNNPAYYDAYTVASLEECQDLCKADSACIGVEFSGSRCEIWIRPDGIRVTNSAAGFECLEALVWSPVDSGEGRACRGDSPGDNLPSYYEVQVVQSLESCQQLCLASEACQGVEYSPGRCELWSHSIWSSISLANFQCYRLVNRKREAFIAEVTANTWPVLGFDAECRGSSSEEDLAQHKGVVQAASLQRCQERCLENTLCQGVEYHLGRCELWIRPEGIGSTANAENHICMGRPSSLPPGDVQTKYVVHYMPWFLSREGGFYDHWCVGNAHYESVFGTYNLSDRDIVRQQLDLMKNSSIDGLWIDYQLASWNAVVDVIMEETAARGMGVAIVIDDAVNPNIFAEVGTKMIEWTSFSHYYRHGGIPIVPVFNTANAIFTPLPFEAYYMARRELARPDWAMEHIHGSQEPWSGWNDTTKMIMASHPLLWAQHIGDSGTATVTESWPPASLKCLSPH